MMMMIMMNCFCDMVDGRKAFSLISSWDHCQRSSLLWISNTPRAGFEPAQNLSADLVEWSCAVVLTTTPRHQQINYTVISNYQCFDYESSIALFNFFSTKDYQPNHKTRLSFLILPILYVISCYFSSPQHSHIWESLSYFIVAKWGSRHSELLFFQKLTDWKYCIDKYYHIPHPVYLGGNAYSMY